MRATEREQQRRLTVTSWMTCRWSECAPILSECFQPSTCLSCETHQTFLLPCDHHLASASVPTGLLSPHFMCIDHSYLVLQAYAPQDILVSLKVADSVIASMGDLWHALSECPEFAYLRAQWSSRCGIEPQFAQPPFLDL